MNNESGQVTLDYAREKKKNCVTKNKLHIEES